ncbi:MAG TPA: cyclic nucleotide-binding domain-containing protein [Acidobacteriota bacterium]
MSTEARTISLTIDDKPVTVAEGTTLWEAALALGISIPALCHQPNLAPVGVCRVCVVAVEGARVFAASCVRQAENGMKVYTRGDRVEQSRKTLVELLLADHPVPCERHREYGDCELEVLAQKMGIEHPSFSPRAYSKGGDRSNPTIAIDHSACIVCDRCVRACTDVKHNDVIGRMGKGYFTSISFDNDKPMGQSSCVNCGECMVSCPTGAITASKLIGTRLEEGESLGAEELLEYPVFSGISSAFLARNEGGVVRRSLKKGEIICRQGEFGSTAFYILHGTVDIFVETPLSHVRTQRDRPGSWFKKMTSLLARPDAHPRSDAAAQSYIPVDATVDLPLDNPVAQLREGDLFGEMTCLNFYPRSATARAAEDCVVLEMLRNVLQILQKNRQFKAQLDAAYRQRALDNHLRSVPMFRNLSLEFIDYLRDRVELLRFEPGEVICRQGDVSESFFLLRIGHVKVTQNYEGGDLVLSYLARGQYFGEIGLLAEGVRTATCTALDHVEVLRISKEDFNSMLERFPDIRRQLEAIARQRTESNRQQATLLKTASLNDFLGQGLMEAQSLLILDLEKCVRCDDCVRACAAAHDGVTRLIRDGLRFDKYLVATSCRQCRDPLCMVGCPVGSIHRKESLEIIIEDWCIGCGLCAQQCPYGNINMHPFEVKEKDPVTGETRTAIRKKATACDLCTDHKEPSCVYACPHDAAHRVDPQEFFDVQLIGSQFASAKHERQ